MPAAAARSRTRPLHAALLGCVTAMLGLARPGAASPRAKPCLDLRDHWGCATAVRWAPLRGLRYDMAERQVQPLVKAPRPGAQQAASLAYDSGTWLVAAWLAVAFTLRQYSSHSAGLFSHLRREGRSAGPSAGRSRARAELHATGATRTALPEALCCDMDRSEEPSCDTVTAPTSQRCCAVGSSRLWDSPGRRPRRARPRVGGGGGRTLARASRAVEAPSSRGRTRRAAAARHSACARCRRGAL